MEGMEGMEGVNKAGLGVRFRNSGWLDACKRARCMQGFWVGARVLSARMRGRVGFPSIAAHSNRPNKRSNPFNETGLPSLDSLDPRVPLLARLWTCP